MGKSLIFSQRGRRLGFLSVYIMYHMGLTRKKKNITGVGLVKALIW